MSKQICKKDCKRCHYEANKCLHDGEDALVEKCMFCTNTICDDCGNFPYTDEEGLCDLCMDSMYHQV